VGAVTTVSEHLEARGLRFEVIPHEEAYTSVDEARALGIAADEVLKTVALATTHGRVLAVVPGSRRLDMKLVRRAVGDSRARLLTEEELEREFPGVELGALPPLGSLFKVPVYVDPEVLTHETVVFAAGTQRESIRIRTQDLFQEEEVRVVSLTRHPEDRAEE
jgi:Ala-tRNA(Pro) deacylase